jgi:predicted MFS family arabinose efflux permease
MFDLTLFRKPTFVGAAIVAFSISSALFAMFLYLVLYIQTLLGYSPLQTGLRFLPFTVVSFFVAAPTGNLANRIPVRFLLGAGLVATGVGLLLLRGLTVTSGWTHLIPGFIVAGAGIGLVNPSLATAAIGVVPPQRSGMASGINNTFRQVGVATGIAALGAIFESALSRYLAPKLAGTSLASHTSSIAHAVAAGGTQRLVASTPATVRPQLSAAIHSAFVGAMNDILLVGGIIALTGAALAFVLVRSRDFVGYGAPEAAPAAAG